jgi:large subunit ribosomal protein L24
MKIKKGDNVVVISGKDRGKSGTVLAAYPKKDLVLVEGVGIVKKHQRGLRRGQAGQIIERAMPIHASNVALKDAKTKKASRVGYMIDGDKKVRVTKASGSKV